MIDVISMFLLVVGCLFFLISAIGVIKFPDSFSRMHAASKASSLGMGLILLSAVLHFESWSATLKAGFAILFIFLTTPVAAHILGRAGYLTGARKWDQNVVDELSEMYQDPSSRA